MAPSGFVGESVVAEKPDQSSAEEQIFIYTHKSFDINYNGDRVRCCATPALQEPLDPQRSPLGTVLRYTS